MNGTKCPKCGSDQILNDQCLKCGIVVSRYRASGPAAGASPVSFVAAPTQNQQPSGSTIPASVLERQQVRRRSSQKTMLVTAAVVGVLFMAGYFAYRFFLLNASHYSGLYKNGKLLFSLKFPESDSQWYHYQPGEPDSALYRGVADAFHRGKDPDHPDIVVGVLTESIAAVPDRLDAGTASRMKSETEDALLQLMIDRGIDGTITNSRITRPGGNDGFRIDADIKMDGRPLKLIAVRAYNVNFVYWFFLSGTEDSMNANEKEVEGLVSSIDFKMSVI
ncbi:MAG TPA: hypothetical protein VLR94_06005 [Acidobacteriota bacterium]|nr:hypothetical protein [Acidobacteriota bacterium]